MTGDTRMILIDTSLYIAAIEDEQLEKILEELSRNVFIQSCDVITEEIHDSSEFLRKTGRKKQSEKLKLIYENIHEGNIRTSDRIIKLSQGYHKEAGLSKKQHEDIENDFIIIASAVIAGVKNIASLNRKTMASNKMVKLYKIVNSRNKYRTPKFLTTKEELSKLLKSL